MVSCSSLFRPGFHAILAALKACSALVSLQSGKIVHNHAIKDGLESDLFISSALVDMYAKCGGSLQDALNVFEKIKKKDVVSWCAMIGGFANRGHGVEALELYDKMEPEGIEPNKVTVVCLLKACTSIRALDQGKNIHSKAVKIGFEADTFVSSTLIDMYVKCRVIADARWIFDELHDRDLVSWNSLISGYVDLANAKEALHLFNEMQQQGKQPDRITFVATIKAHGLDSNLHECDLVHDDVVKRGLVSDVCIGSCLVDMYAKCGTVESARAVFDRLSKRDVIAWSAMISAYVGNGFGNEALNLYKLMLQSGIEPDRITLMCIFKSCTLLDSSNICKLLHLDALYHGLDSDFMIESMLIGTYFKTGNILDACKIFEMSQVQNVSIWNAMLTGYAENGQNQEVFRLFEQMEEKAIETDEVTYGCMLKASSNGNALDWGNLIHGRIMMRGFDFNIVLANGLIDMYGKCHCLENAFHVFQTLPVSNVITWCALISGLAESGYLHEAMHYYKAMGQNDLAPNEVAFVSILTCCASKGAVSEGMMMHLDAIKQGFDGDECVGNILVDMYTKGRSLNEACVIFDQMPYRTVVTWSSLIGGHVDYGQSEEAFSLLHRMGQEGACGNEITYICILKACSNLSCFHCKQLHTHIITKDLDTVPSIGNTLIGMYSSCGDLTMASEVFHKMKVLDAVTWNAIIGGYAEHGDYKSAMVHFESMVFKEHLKPDHITFVNILTACSHAGLLHESCYYFNLSNRFRLVPTIEHCLCLFDVLRRTDRLNDADAFVDNMPYSPTTAFWIALLSSCAMGKNLELGKRAIVNLIEADQDNIPGLVMMSNLYSAIREHDIVGE
jgi:pentatricopeptide repeat protein